MDIPLRSSAADRTRPTVWDGLVVLVILLLAGALFAALLPKETGGSLTLLVTLDGEEIGRYDLDEAAEGTLVTIEAPYPMTIELSPRGVRVAETACPHGDCAAAGWIDRAGEQIVCLPNRLILSLEGEETTDIDVVIG